MTARKICKLIHLGRLAYEDAWKLQENIAAARRGGTAADTLLFVEHDPVLTIGRAGDTRNILAGEAELVERDIKVLEVDRGGDVTYHGPGQLVGYPVLDLRNYGKDLHRYARMLEEVLIRTLAQYGIHAFREPGLTGVWTAAGKIAAIGIGVRNWVSMHGFALNVHTDMRQFALINPCGITDRPVASMRQFGVNAGLDEVAARVAEQFSAVFAVPVVPVPSVPVPPVLPAQAAIRETGS